jgi:peptidoglycan hydrolase CwlO-like protein
MSNEIVSRLLDFTPLKDVDLAKLMLDAANEIERLQSQLQYCQAERDHHLKWSRTYEAELKELRNKIKKNSN